MDYQQGIRYLGLAVLILCFGNVEAGDATIQTPPNDVVASKGDNPQFFCKISASDSSTEAVVWERFLYGDSVTARPIYDTNNNQNSNPDKFHFNKTATLTTYIVVKNVETNDAGSYKCRAMATTGTEATAELVVVDTPRITILHALENDKPGHITCDIYYLRSDNSNAEAIEPQMFISIGTQSLSTANRERSNPVEGDKRYKLSLTYNGTMYGSQHGENFTCGAKVQRSTPSVIDYIISESKELQIKSPTTKVEISEPIQEIYYTGDIINCTADGYPEPKLIWKMLKSGAGVYDKTGGDLVITEEMIGNNTWRCEAEQYTNPPGKVMGKVISFQVMKPTNKGPGKSTDADNTTTIVVAVVVPVVVILILIIVVCVVCKKKKSGEAKPKRGEGVEAGPQKQRNQIYKPVSTNPEGQVRFQEEKASYRAKDPAGRPSPAPRQTEAAQAAEEVA